MERKNTLKAIWSMLFIIAMLFCLCGCSGVEKSLHISYVDADPNTVEGNYGKGNYVYSTVTFTGDALGKETILSVKDLEERMKDDSLAYEGSYSFLTRGSVFSTHKIAGLRLYELLLSIGMDDGLADDTRVTVIARDGYTTVLTLKDLRESRYGLYDGIGGVEPKESGLPVLLGFSSDGLPLVGATGSEKAGKQFSEEEGYDSDADNIGGPVRLIIGQTSSGDYNAPQNGKWACQVIVGEEKSYALHDAATKQETAVTVSVYDSTKKNKLLSSSDYTFADLENSEEEAERNYYGSEGFYQGVDLWTFLTKEVGVNSQEGTVTFCYEDGSDETVSLEYIRNMGGDFEDYTVEKEGLTITCVKPALGYSKDGSPSDGKAFALLPAKKGVKDSSTAKACTALEISIDGSDLSETNPYKNRRVSITGEGVKQAKGYTIGQMEKNTDLQVKTREGFSGVSLSGLLEESDLTVDAQKVTITGAEGEETFTLEELKKEKEQILLATRKNGKALSADQGPIYLTGERAVADVRKITVQIKPGQWKHEEDPYDEYLDNILTISGSEAKAKKTYTLRELENLGSEYTVKDSFGASAGINGYQGVLLKALIEDNLKKGMDKPSKITIIGKDGYSTEVSVSDVYKGIRSKYQDGQRRDVILAYSVNGTPLVSGQNEAGYNGENQFGPLELIVENQISKWVKSVEEIRLGE